MSETYTYSTRREFYDARYKKWQRSHMIILGMLANEMSTLFAQRGSYISSDTLKRQRDNYFEDHHGEDCVTLEEFFRKHLMSLVNAMVPRKYQDEYFSILRRMNEIPYTKGIGRRTLRSKDPKNHFGQALEILLVYQNLSILDVSPAEYLCQNIPGKEETYDYLNNNRLYYISYVLSERINQNDKEVTEAIREAILSERNDITVSYEMIGGIVKSDNDEMHDLLCRLLVAARLQEGLRQAICESGDESTPKFFVKLMATIYDNDLLRFSAVKRAVYTWCGIGNEENQDRITSKLFKSMLTAIMDTNEAEKMCETDDSILITIGLWGLGFCDVKLALAKITEMIRNGSRHQVLAVSYYLQMIQNTKEEEKAFDYVMENYPDDLEVQAAYFPCYLPRLSTRIYAIEHYDSNREASYDKIDVVREFGSQENLKKHYDFLKKLLQSMKKSKVVYSPIIFDWYGVSLEKSALAGKMGYLAYASRNQDLMDDMCDYIGMVGSELDGVSRFRLVRMLFDDPKTEKQRKTLVSLLTDKESYTRREALKKVRKMKLTDEEYQIIENGLKYKTEDIRMKLLEVLKERKDLNISIERMLKNKDSNIVSAAITLMKDEIEKGTKNKEKYLHMIAELNKDNSVSVKQQIIVQDLLNEKSSSSTLNEKGFGLYNPDIEFAYEKTKCNVKKIRDYFNLSKAEIDAYIKRIEDFYTAHGNMEYKDFNGEKVLLANGLHITRFGGGLNYPFPELWEQLYDEIIQDERIYWNIRLALLRAYQTDFDAAETKVFGDLVHYRKSAESKYHIRTDYVLGSIDERILLVIGSIKKFTFPWEMEKELIAYLLETEDRKIRVKRTYGNELNNLANSVSFDLLMKTRTTMDQTIPFKEIFTGFYQLDKEYRFNVLSEGSSEVKDLRFTNYSRCYLDIFDYLKALDENIISEDEVYKAVFENLGPRNVIGYLSRLFTKKYQYMKGRMTELGILDENGNLNSNSPIYQKGKEVYFRIIDVILNVELKRSETPTAFSYAIHAIEPVLGISRLKEIMMALGNDTLDRSAYYSWYSNAGRKSCLSHLLKVCYPLENETQEDFDMLVKELKLKPQRLSEIAMFAPQWAGFVETNLQMPGFVSGCYYFMAHMNEHFDDEKKAVIARYTPLSDNELNQGCFDTKWFFEVYKQLGEDNFMLLYNAAKYIADGNKHSRARKYADAALGKVTREKLEQVIDDKRNKDNLMSYGLIPIQDEKDILHRYQYLQQFLKQSKQFGAQRRASEASAVDAALKNLATTAGYDDSLRLTLAMETALVEENSSYLQGMEIEGYFVKVVTQTNGKAELRVGKDGKTLKSLPAALKKNETVTEMKNFVSLLKQQYSRCVAMFENAMETRELYKVSELKQLSTNPVIAPIIHNLVLMNKETSCLLTNLSDENLEVRFAHPFDLYTEKTWSSWQKYFYEKAMEGIKQPFKQVFRELYLKLEEEMDESYSRMYAGYQIQPAKTLATLKSRKWVSDYDEGLQKIYYKDDVAAVIYALADWFSPADIEAPTIEYVCFHNRRNYQLMSLKEVDDIIYSEVMRDVDLVVSVAYAGGVDPMTSHSTMEMRKVIGEFNAQLFNLENVRFEGSHAFIKGKYGDYTVQLGSGLVHKSGLQINILPVHSQQRGKLFIPFVDEDPKTAEIMTKIIMLAQDDKIKDPTILNQLKK